MRRSEINRAVEDAVAFFSRQCFHLPPFAFWTPEEWVSRQETASSIIERGLGWDITDFGSGDFAECGLLLFTLRNGVLEDLKDGRGEVYAEKIMVVQVGQLTPLHFHWSKVEDIINRGGGDLLLRLYPSGEDGKLGQGELDVRVNGMTRCLKSGQVITLTPGECITLRPGCYHEFWGGKEPVLVGEVSSVNDDLHDNRFYLPAGRFPGIEEDEAPKFLLCSDYSRYL